MGLMWQKLEQSEHRTAASGATADAWLPRSVRNYLDHTEMGISIRALARQQGCHASTILRQIRRVETSRDDPLVDGMLKTLGEAAVDVPRPPGNAGGEDTGKMSLANRSVQELPNAAQLDTEGVRVLRRLCEKGAVLAVAADLDKAVIVRDGHEGQSTRTGVVDRAIAEAIALKGWIAASTSGRITRYQITAAGRAALTDMMARVESAQASGAPEGYDRETGTRTEPPRRIRYALAESPLAALARRRDRDGTRFLSSDLVHAGERLREDFEMPQLGATAAQNWEEFLRTHAANGQLLREGGSAAVQAAQERVLSAMQDLGPGLSDIGLRCCCYLEGLETAEKRLGWSARSGKIVLRIALMRLKRHYDENSDGGGALIG